MSPEHSSAAPLSRNNRLVLDALTGSGGPMSAYDLLDKLRTEGLRAPPQVYRALKALAQQGLVHKLESANAYVACAHAICCGGQRCATSHIIFFLCDACGHVQEVNGEPLGDGIETLATRLGFAAQASSLEVHGQCAACQAET